MLQEVQSTGLTQHCRGIDRKSHVVAQRRHDSCTLAALAWLAQLGRWAEQVPEKQQQSPARVKAQRLELPQFVPLASCLHGKLACWLHGKLSLGRL